MSRSRIAIAVDYAHVSKDLADIHFANAKTIVWSRIISTSTTRLHFMKRSLQPRPGDWSSASNGATPQNTAAGSIWRNPRSASYLCQCLDCRIPDKQTLTDEIAAWE